jgi:hypothetical protein
VTVIIAYSTGIHAVPYIVSMQLQGRRASQSTRTRNHSIHESHSCAGSGTISNPNPSSRCQQPTSHLVHFVSAIQRVVLRLTFESDIHLFFLFGLSPRTFSRSGPRPLNLRTVARVGFGRVKVGIRGECPGTRGGRKLASILGAPKSDLSSFSFSE